MNRYVLTGVVVGLCLVGALACTQPGNEPASQGTTKEPMEVTVAPTPSAPAVAPQPAAEKPAARPKAARPKAAAPNPTKVKTEKLAALEQQYGQHFAAGAEGNLFKLGDFEGEWPEKARLPEGWGPLARLATPSQVRRAEGYGKVGNVSARVMGTTEADVSMKALEVPPIEDLRGKEVVFGAWVKTQDPSRVVVRMIDSWKRYHEASPTLRNQWQLVIVKGAIPADSEGVNFAVTIRKTEPAAEALIDGAAITVLP